MIKQSILAFSLVGLVDLEAEAQDVQHNTTTTTVGNSTDAPTQQQGVNRGNRGRSTTTDTRSAVRGSTIASPTSPGIAPAAPVSPVGGNMTTPGTPVESAMPGTNRAPVINNGVNPDGTPRNGALGNGNSIRPNTTISNGTYNNPTGGGQNTNTGDGTNTITTPNSGSRNGGGSTVPAGTNSPR